MDSPQSMFMTEIYLMYNHYLTWNPSVDLTLSQLSLIHSITAIFLTFVGNSEETDAFQISVLKVQNQLMYRVVFSY
jgi:hypothetical protein